MSPNLITRMGAASGVVAALVAAVFAVLITAVSDLREATSEVRSSEQVIGAALEVESLLGQYHLSLRADLAAEQQRHGRLLPVARARLLETGGDRLARQLDRLDADLAAYVRTPGTAAAHRLQRDLRRLADTERLRADTRTRDADRSMDRAVTLGIVGLVGSAALIALLTAYLSRAIVVPLRRTARAARRLASGDLGARVIEEGDAEPRELARSFNSMADALQAQQDELASQNAELAGRRAELEAALEQLAAEKRRVETFQRAGEQLAAELGLDEVAEVALRELCDAAGAEVGALYAGDGAPVPLLVSRGLDGTALAPDVRPNDGLAGRALAEHRTVTAGTGSTGMRVRVLGGRTHIQGEAHVPLCLGDRAVGVVSLARLSDRPFAPEELATVERLADQAAVALANVFSYREALHQARINRAVLDATPDAIALLDRHGEVVLANEPMRTLLAEGAPVHVPRSDPQSEQSDELELAGGTYARYVAPVHDASGTLVGRLVLLRDVTAERASERLKDEFFALVSHELRTPLTSIIGYLELVLDDEEDLGPEARRFLEIVDRNARRLLRLVGDMLFVAQVEAGRLSLEHGEVDLLQVAGEAVQAARPAAEQAGVELVLQADPVQAVQGDRDRFGQMLDNLVSNALKFSAPGACVRVTLREQGDVAVLEVADEGPGISPAEQEHLFERFWRSPSASRAAVPGAGLGLSIVKTIVEAHRGSIEVDSREGAGALFRVRLPYARVAGQVGAAG